MKFISYSSLKHGFGFRYILIIIILVLFINGASYAQTNEETGSQDKNIAASSDEGSFTHKEFMRNSILFGSIPVTLLFGVKAWDWGSRHEFKSEREGWFGQDTSAGGSDKAGHFFAHYTIQRFVYFIFDYTEDGASRKYAYSILTTTIVGTCIEVGDGWSSLYGFSYEDLLVDLAGLFTGALLDYFPVLGAFVGFSVDYVPTSYYKKYFNKHETVPLGWVTDYSGFRFMMNFKLAGFKYIGLKVPEFMRYITLDLGFFTKDFSAYEGEFKPSGSLRPTRNWFVGVSINMSEIMRDFYTEKKGALYTLTTTPFEYYHVPVGYRNEKEIR